MSDAAENSSGTVAEIVNTVSHLPACVLLPRWCDIAKYQLLNENRR